MIMGFFGKLFKGKGLYTDKRNPGMVCEMALCGQKYILSGFDMAYEPENSMKEYFEAYAVFAEPVNTAVEQWITKADRRESGVVKFFRNSDALSEGALFEIRFREASCVRYRTVSHGGISVKTVVMTFPAVSLDGEEYEIRK